MAKFIFVTGGVVSGLGKGITAASLGRLLKCRGLKVASQKLDPYVNVDPGTMSPLQHGEVFVTDDGTETDLDLGHYERFIDENLNKYSNLTTGKVYWNVLNKERQGDLSGPDRPDHPPHHQRDQELHLQHGMRDRCRCGHHRDRRHHRRYREPALPGGHPSGGPGTGPRQLLLHPCCAGALYLRLRRATSPSRPSTPSRSCRAWA